MSQCLEFDPDKRANIDELVQHKFLQIGNKTIMQSQEAINFMSLYSIVAMNENPMPKKQTESVERLSIIQAKSKYQSRESLMNSYKITPELSKALGYDIQNEKKASLRHINIDLENLKRYSRNSTMLQSLTNLNQDDVFKSQTSTYSNPEENQFESSKLAHVLKKLQAK
jgi:hypothetical protein